MSITINAIYEEGVLKPLDKVPLREHEKVKIDINPDEKLKKRLKHLTESIYKRTNKFSSKEIEQNISLAYGEIREKS